MYQYEKENLGKVCTPTEIKFIVALERFLKTHPHGDLSLFGHNGHLCIEKDVPGVEPTIRLVTLSTNLILCDGGDPNEGEEFIDIDNYIANYIEREAQ